MVNRDEAMNGDNGEWDFPSGKELGPILRARREELGLTYGDITAQIRVKERYLEAIENEAWENLPPPAFVRGFIRSYARVLGLPEERLVALYRETAPQLSPPTTAMERSPAQRRARALPYLIGILVLLVAAAGAYLWFGLGWLKERQAPKAMFTQGEERGIPSTRQTGHPPSAPAETVRKGTGDDSPSASDENPSESLPSPPAGAGSTAAPERREPERSVPHAGQVSESDQGLVLKATVRERTWVRVTIDNEKPKEYTLNPGSQPEWRAQKGFELLIGNAGGIDLELNGNKLGRPGRRGQVVKLRLPSTERSASGD